MKLLVLIAALASSIAARSQSLTNDATPVTSKSETSKGDFGIGLGLDYGGIGGRLTFLPEKHVGLFASVGYAIVGAGYNVGAKTIVNPDSKTRVALGGMYGYNAVINVSGASQYNKIYYGTSIFVGVEFRSRYKPKDYFNLELIVPFRSQEFQNDYDALKANPAITFKNSVLPIAVSLGYHFGF